MLFESNTETGKISVMRGFRQVLVKVVLFWIRGPGHPQDDTNPNFFPDSKSSILGLSNEVSFVSKLFWKSGKNQEKENLHITPNVSNWDSLYIFGKFLILCNIKIFLKQSRNITIIVECIFGACFVIHELCKMLQLY